MGLLVAPHRLAVDFDLGEALVAAGDRKMRLAVVRNGKARGKAAAVCPPRDLDIAVRRGHDALGAFEPGQLRPNLQDPFGLRLNP